MASDSDYRHYPDVFRVVQSVTTAGDTSTPSVIKFDLYQDGVPMTTRPALRFWICNDGTYANSTNATIAPTSGEGTTIVTHTSTKDLSIRADASKTSISVSVTDGSAETVTLRWAPAEFGSMPFNATAAEVDITHAAP